VSMCGADGRLASMSGETYARRVEEAQSVVKTAACNEERLHVTADKESPGPSGAVNCELPVGQAYRRRSQCRKVFASLPLLFVKREWIGEDDNRGLTHGSFCSVVRFGCSLPD